MKRIFNGFIIVMAMLMLLSGCAGGDIIEETTAESVLYEKLTDRAEYTNPFLHAEGLNYVIIGGSVVAKDATYTGELPAAMLLKEV